MPRIKERRHEPRTPTVHPVNVLRHDAWGFPIDTRLGRSLDLSHNGMCIELDHQPRQDEKLEMTLALGEHVIPLTGRVRSIRDRADGKVALGVQFVDLDRRTYELIHQFLKLNTRRNRWRRRRRSRAEP